VGIDVGILDIGLEEVGFFVVSLGVGFDVDILDVGLEEVGFFVVSFGLGFDVGILDIDSEEVGFLEVGFVVLGFSVDLMSFGIHDLILVQMNQE